MTQLTVTARRFEKFSACDAADALVALGFSDGGAIPFLRQISGSAKTIAGPAYTVEFADKSDPRPPVNFNYIDRAPAGSIVLLGTAKSCQTAVFPYTTITTCLYGGLMSTRAKFLNCRGTVVLGSVRDVAEHRELEYPVFSYSTGVCSPSATAKVVSVGAALAVEARSKIVRPKDIVVADENGVVIVPYDLANRCLEYMEKRVEADRLISEDIQRGIECAVSIKNRRKNL